MSDRTTRAPSVQQELVQRLMARRLAGARATATEVPRLPAGARIPLSPAQARIWFFTRLFPDSTEYNGFGVVRLAGCPGRDDLDRALRALVGKHDALRLRVVEVDGEPLQEDAGQIDPPVTWHDLGHLPPAEAEARVQEIGNAAKRRPFRPEQPPLFHVEAVRMPGGAARLIVVLHHLVVDGWSWELLTGDLAAALRGEAVEPGPVGYLDYVAWCHRTEDAGRLADDLAHWKRTLGGELPVLDLPKDRPRPAFPTRGGRGTSIGAPAEVAAALRRLAEREGTTPFVVALAAYQVTLHRLTGQTDLVVGTAFAGRDDPVAERLVGCFVKPVGLRAAVDRSLPFRAVVARAHATVTEAQDHQAVPFEQVVAELGVARDLGVHPVFQTWFGLQSSDDPWLTADMFLEDYGAAKFDVTVNVTEGPGGVAGYMECSADLFEQATLDRFARLYERLLHDLVAEPDVAVGRHPLVTADERDHILHHLNPHATPAHPFPTLAAPFEAQADRTPEAVALADEDGATLTYAELNERANRVARFLRGAGAGPGERVALCLERSIGMVVAVHAVAKTGATYVPLEPELPDARLRFMLDDTAPLLVLTDRRSRERMAGAPVPVVSLDDDGDGERWHDLPSGNLGYEGPANPVSHLLYTSGSTGRPKAVACALDGALADMFGMQASYPYRPGDVTVLKTSYGFDVSLWELFWPLWFGARLVVCRPGAHRDPGHLVRLIEAHGVTTIYLIPTLLQVFVDELPPGSCRSLRRVLSGGEPITPRLRDAFHAALEADLVNGYGPTEVGCATDMVVPREPGAPVVPLGRPATNFRLYVLDDDLEVLPLGVPGQAFIAGDVGPSHGYHRRPGLTAESFLPDPFGPPGRRMYRTGDICRYRDDGVLEHLGRRGRQVKVNGMRIELAEVEAVLCEHGDVDECAAVVAGGEPGTGQAIAAFVVARPGAAPRPEALLAHAAAALPRYMVPTTVVAVPDIPVSVNGKTDHAALLARLAEQRDRALLPAGREVVPPADDLERELAGLFGRVLGLAGEGEVADAAGVGVTDSFFALGGHSLLVFKLIAACTKELHVTPSVADVFAAPSVRELARSLRSSLAAPETSLVPLAAGPGRPVLALVHAVSGSALPFAELARHLGDDLSVHGLQAPGPEASLAGASVANLAARYVAAVDAVRGMSPLVVAGWSMGGCVALEMARLWAERGVPVARVLLLDTWVPPIALPTVAEQARVRAATGEIDRLALAGLDPERLDDPDIAAELRRLEEVQARNRDAFLAHQPGPYDGEVDLLHAADVPPALAAELPDAYLRPDRGWGGHLPGLRVHRVPGDHFTLLDPEHVPRLAATIRGLVDDALAYGVLGLDGDGDGFGFGEIGEVTEIEAGG